MCRAAHCPLQRLQKRSTPPNRQPPNTTILHCDEQMRTSVIEHGAKGLRMLRQHFPLFFSKIIHLKYHHHTAITLHCTEFTLNKKLP